MRFEKVSLETFMMDLKRHGFVGGYLAAYKNIKLPERKTKYSAGYDFVTPIPFVLHPGEKITIPTGIKVYFEPEKADKYHLQLFIRSSVGIRQNVVLANQTGVIDSDYYDNSDNEGDMLIALRNVGDESVKFRAGDRIMQGIFMRHWYTEDDNADGIRTGGVGSTGD